MSEDNVLPFEMPAAPSMIVDTRVKVVNPAPGIDVPTLYEGVLYNPVKTFATGQWQILRLDTIKCYILVHPNGKQAWFNDDQINEIIRRYPNFKFTSRPLRDLNQLAKLGLRPFHVDADFDPTGLEEAR